MSKEFLRRLSFFEGLSEADLERLYELAEPVSIAAGECLMREGEPADAVYVVLDGRFEVTKLSGEQDIIIGGCAPGDVVGEIGLLEGAARTATVCALRASHLLRISTDAFYALLCTRSAAEAVLGTVLRRLRNTESMLMQKEKLAALGNMAAGLAHELNNPAAAVRRSADQLAAALGAWQEAARRLGAANPGADTDRQLTALDAEARRRASSPVDLDPLARSDQENELEAWLQESGLDRAYELAPALVAAGWDRPSLESLCAGFAAEERPAAIEWMAAASFAYNLLHELGISARRISEIVKSVKDYSYLGQAPVQQVNVQDGLEETLVMLRYKLKAGIRVTRQYAPDLPSIEAYGSELNQVWTNIIDNAIDAMGEHGELTVRAYPKAGAVVVEVADDGPAIPPDVQRRIFDPFFTTKGPGVGTGLGLHISRNIIELRHHGQIAVSSRPGETTFRITLPLRLGSG